MERSVDMWQLPLFLAFAIAGLAETWVLLMFWGFSQGAVGAVPFITLTGGLILTLVSAPMALFVPRISAVTSMLASSLILAWPASMMVSGDGVSGIVFAVPPLLASGVASRHLWRTRTSNWREITARPALWLRILVAASPVVVFVLVFNAPLVFALLLEGPPE